MKKITFLMALLVVLSCSAFGCNTDEDKNNSKAESSSVSENENSNTSSDVSDNTSKDENNETKEDFFAKAQALISEGKYSEAYGVAYEASETDEDCKNLLKDFVVVPTEENTKAEISTSYISYKTEATTKYTYDAQGRKIKEETTDSEEGTQTSEWFYNQNGDIVKEISTDDMGYTNTIENLYDTEGRLIKTLSTSAFEGEDPSSYSEDYIYNEKGQLVMKIFADSDCYGYTDVYTYNEQGVLIKETQTDSDGELGREVFYNEKGLILKEIEYLYGEPFFINEYTYDEKGNLLIKFEDYGEETGNSATEYTYDSQNRVLTEKYSTFYPETNEIEVDYSLENTYDSNGNLIKCVTNIPEIGITTIEYIYDSKGRILKETETTNSVGENFTIDYNSFTEYTYDKNGNTIKISGNNLLLGNYTTQYSGFLYFYCPQK